MNERPQRGPGRITSREDLREFDGRLRLLVVLFAIPLAGLLFRLHHLQIVEGDDLYRLANENFVREVELAPDRGRIYDARGRVIAENRPSWDVYVTPSVIRRDAAAIDRLAEVLSLSDDDLERLDRRIQVQGGADVLVRRDITRDQLARLETIRGEIPGSYVVVSQQRHYPFDELGAHLLGYMNEIRDDELERLEPYGYHVGDYIGRTGVERAFEALLRGAPGLERQVVDVSGEVQSDDESALLLGDYRHVGSVPGKNLHLTVDMQLQEIVAEAASSHVSGGIVAVDPRDGSILSMFSRPGFNPNAWSGRLSEQEQRLSDNNPFHPMLDKSVQSWFPGSTWKVITAIAALEEGLVDHEHTIECPGYLDYGDRRFHCWNRGGHGELTLAEALEESCDVYFYEVGLELGLDRLASYAFEFGFGERPGLGFNGDSPGIVPTRAWHEEHSPGGFQYGFTVNTSVGQGDTRVSPLQLALAYAAIANGGTLYYPRIVDRVTTWDDTVLFEYPRRVRRELPFAESHMAIVVQGLVDVLHGDSGTAAESALPWTTSAGKTGTAQVRSLESVRLEDGEVIFRDRDHAWFVAFAPAENPLIVVSVFLEHGGQGSSAAAPVAMEIIDRYFREVLGWDDIIETAIVSGDYDDLQDLYLGEGQPFAALPELVPRAPGVGFVPPPSEPLQ